MPEPLEPGLFTQVFTSLNVEAERAAAESLDAIADMAVNHTKKLLTARSADVFGPSTAPVGEPPATRSGTLADSIGRDEVATTVNGSAEAASVLIGPRRGFRTPYGTKREAYIYGGHLEHEQGHPFLKRAVRESAAVWRQLTADKIRLIQWMGARRR